MGPIDDPQADLNSADPTADREQDALAPPRKGGPRIQFYTLVLITAWTLVVVISLGVAVYPQHGQDPEALLQAADKALYQAKHAGRDRVVAANGSSA